MVIHNIKWHESEAARRLCANAIVAGATDCSITYLPESFIMVNASTDNHLITIKLVFNEYTCESGSYFTLTTYIASLNSGLTISKSFDVFEKIRSENLYSRELAEIVEAVRNTIEPYVEWVSKKLRAMSIDVDKCSELEEKAMKMLAKHLELI